jgi:predicted aminopeptidase
VLVALLAVVPILTGCGGGGLHYITQAAAGQEKLNGRGVDIREIVEGEHLDRRTRELLAHVSRIKAFGERQGLRRTNNYERYVWLGRPAVVWVVSACHPVAFRPKVWKFPVVGSITYTGWFDRAEARAYGDELRRKGWDVDVRPSQAYSTLGWFDDPILSTMISPDDDALGDLADVVLHETLHATFYVPGQSTLNESIAAFVGNELAVKYLEETLGLESKEKEAFLDGRARGERRGRLMKSAYEKLAALYASKHTRAEKLAEKARITGELRHALAARRPITNATLIQYKTYGSGKEEIRGLFEQCGRDMGRFLGALERLRPIAASATPHSDPGELVRPLLGHGC